MFEHHILKHHIPELRTAASFALGSAAENRRSRAQGKRGAMGRGHSKGSTAQGHQAASAV